MVNKDTRWVLIFLAMIYLVTFVFPPKACADSKWLKHFRKDSLLNTYKTCYAITEDTLWIGTSGDGVLIKHADGTTKSLTNQNTRSTRNIDDGLVTDQVTCITVDEAQGHLWVGTNEGLSRCNLDGTEWLRFTEKDGLLNSIIRDIDTDSAGNVWIGTPSGLMVFDGEKLSPVTDAAAQGSIRSIKVKDNAVWVGKVSGNVSCFKDGQWFSISTL
jgi:hypothetical protein